ncbi:radical SAM family heme chaperone HemW [Planctopirus limnophila]|nr:radical SAM family heme chaperone HemW [Planctopirus limnophila]
MTHTNNFQSVYIHVPFCRHRCGYCDFTLVAGRDDLIPRYLAALEREMQAHDQPLVVQTVFFGGGTPTHLPIVELEQLLKMVTRRFPLADGGEFSIEANPLDMTEEVIDVLHSAGCNRVSLGVQSFQNKHLQTLERDHQGGEIPEIVQRIRARIPNVSLDLIFGVPGQTLVDWEYDLEQALACGPTHLSTYGLTFEEGTAFTTRKRRGQLTEIDEALEREMYALAIKRLQEEGFEHYELSNFARPGYQCQHNLAYWNGSPYAAFGPGAASYLQGTRRTNTRSVLGYLSRMEQGASVIAEAETLEKEHAMREALYVGLRRLSGMDYAEFQHRFGIDLQEFAAETIQRLVRQGLLAADEKRIRLTSEGIFLANRVMAEFL